MMFKKQMKNRSNLTMHVALLANIGIGCIKFVTVAIRSGAAILFEGTHYTVDPGLKNPCNRSVPMDL
jgi:hypothetical protein